MSRQRLHPSLVEASTEACPHCHGTGRVRSVESTALHVLRMAEEEIARNFSPGVTIFVPNAVALFMLNHKRRSIEEIEQRRGVRVYLQADDELTPPEYRLDRIKQLNPGEEVQPRAALPAPVIEDEPDNSIPEELEAEAVEAEAPEEAENQPRQPGRAGARWPQAPAPPWPGRQVPRRRIHRERRRARIRGSAAAPRPERPEAAVAPIVALADGPDDEAIPTRTTMPMARKPEAARAKTPARAASSVAGGGAAAGAAGAGRGVRIAISPARRRHSRKAGRIARNPAKPPHNRSRDLAISRNSLSCPSSGRNACAPLTNETGEQAGAAAASEGTNGEPRAAEPQARRRQRRPRRRDDDAAAPVAEAAREIEVPRAMPSPAEPASVPQPVAAPSPAQIIEVGAESEQAGDDGQRKRGWWRRLIE